MSEVQVTNVPEISVSELSGALKRTIEDRFGFVRVRGEISNYRGPHSSGHAYFCLKDQNARIDAVIWKGVFQRIEGQAAGRPRSHRDRQDHDLSRQIDLSDHRRAIEPAGIGALMALVEERRRRLAAEGLFRRGAQAAPAVSARGASASSPRRPAPSSAIFCTVSPTASRATSWSGRCGCKAKRAARSRRRDRRINALPEEGALPRPDVIIVARGGGSLEDLWGFNEEIVVRAAAREPSCR